MEQPTTPKKTRPGLGKRSHTASPVLSSSPSEDPRKTATSSLQEAAKKPKQHHHRGIFHSAHPDNRHHHGIFHSAHPDNKQPQAAPSSRNRRNDDLSSSKTNLRQHLPTVHPIDGLTHIMSNRSGQKGSNGSSTRSAVDSQKHVRAEPLLRVPSNPVRPEAVERERAKGRVRDRELHSSLDALSNFATDSTRRLDLAFYSILEKAGQLHSTISSLQELSDASNELHASFKKDVANVDSDVQGQIDAFAGFKKQQDEIERLEVRIKGGQERSEQLVARLEAARRRVELWETRETEWQKKTTKRLTFSWVCAAAATSIIIALVVWKRILSADRVRSQFRTVPETSLPPFIVEDIYNFREKWNRSRPTATSSTMPALTTDKGLRLLDEL